MDLALRYPKTYAYTDEAYERAAYLPKLKKTGTIVLTDLDGTMTNGTQDPHDNELRDRINVRALLEAKGVVAGAVTARTASLTLSSKSFAESASVRRHEYPPKWGFDPKTNKRIRVPLESKSYFTACLDFDFTASFGSIIAVKNNSCSYLVDEEFFKLLRYDYIYKELGCEMEREPWRHVMEVFLASEKMRPFLPYRSKLEDPYNYYDGVTDSAPLHFRYQYDFIGEAGLDALRDMKGQLDDARSNNHPLALRINMVDESRPDINDSAKSRYTLYLIPWNASKEKMVHRAFSQSVKAAGVDVKDTRLFYAGDTLTDLRTGLWAGGDAKMTFLLATGSRLAPYLMERRRMFGDEDLSFLWPKAQLGPNKLLSRLVATNRKGIYRFVHKIRKDRVNTVIIGDERYPGLTAPGSVHAFLQEFL